MPGNSIRVGFAVALLAVALSGGVASAAPAGCPFSDCADQEGEVEGAGEVEAGSEVNTTATADDTEAVEAVTATNPVSSGGVLPFTGGDVIGLTVIGAAALGVGTVLVRRTRSRSIT